MSVAGGRALHGLCVAGAILLLLLPILPSAPAQGSSDPWWGPSDRNDPLAGFSVRVPITVENPYDYPLTDPFVAAELDFTKLLVEAGWTNQTIGAELRLRGFTLDVDSIRVVPYHRGFVAGPVEGAAQQPLAHVFYPALLEAPKFRDFDPARSPGGTVMFQIEGMLLPQQKRDFYVYAKPVEYGKTAPHVPQDPTTRGPLEAYLWGTTGTVTYGFEPNQPGQQHKLRIESLVGGINKVTVSTFELGRYVPVPPSTTYPNPFTLASLGASQAFLIPSGKAYKVESERPVRVQAFGQSAGPSGIVTSASEARGYMPGPSGSFADDTISFGVIEDQPQNLVLVKASPGTVTITSSDMSPSTVTLTNAVPFRAGVGLQRDSVNNMYGGLDGRVDFQSTGGKFMVFNAPRQLTTPSGATLYAPFPLHQVPSTNGGPLGDRFFGFVMSEAGFVRVCAETNASVYMANTDSRIGLAPDGAIENTPPRLYTPSTFCDEVEVPRTASPSTIHEFYSVIPTNAPSNARRGEFRLLLGAGDRSESADGNNWTRPALGPFGGLAGIDFDLYGKVGLFGHYNGTRVTIFEERERPDGTRYVTNRTRGLQRDEFVTLLPSADSTGAWHVVANKPIGATSIEDAVVKQDDGLDTGGTIDAPIGYAFHIPGRPPPPRVTVGSAEFRGPLVDLRSDATPFLATGPASPVSYRLDVVNLGRWVNGEDLPDTITVSCSTPVGWRVDACAKEVTLGSRSSERLNIVITPSADDVNVTRPIVVEARSKYGSVATFKINVHVEIRYGVGMWFDVEGGRKTIDPPVGLDPGQTHAYNIVLKNTGSTQDSFALALDDPREGWTQDLLHEGEPISSVRLDGGESVVLQFRVKAPNAESAPQNIVSIVAQSASSALAADVVNTATRIRPKVDLALTLEPQTRLAEPNETVVFNISTRNKGNDVFTVLFAQDSILPKGWEARLSVPEITLNPNPGNDPTLNYVLQLFVTPPPGARAGDLASVKIAAEIDAGSGLVPGDEISAVVVVRRVYDLRMPPIPDAQTPPGQELRFVLPVTNHGNGQVGIEVLEGALAVTRIGPDGDEKPAAGWSLRLDTPPMTLALNETADLELAIGVPAAAAPGTYNVTFTTRLSKEAFQNLTVPVQVVELSRAEYVGAKTLALVPGRPVSLAYSVRNTGNVEGVFDLRASLPPSWQANVSPARARLAPGDVVPVTVVLNASRDAPEGDVVARLEAQALPAAATPTDLRIRVARPALFLGDVTATGALRAGELVLVSATVGNTGSIDATNVSVALTVDGRVVDRVLLSRVPVGSSSVATLSWVATQRGGDVKLVLDPEQEIALASREDTEAEVSFASTIPGPGVLALLAVLGVLARMTVRRSGRVPPAEGSSRHRVIAARWPERGEE